MIGSILTLIGMITCTFSRQWHNVMQGQSLISGCSQTTAITLDLSVWDSLSPISTMIHNSANASCQCGLTTVMCAVHVVVLLCM